MQTNDYTYWHIAIIVTCNQETMLLSKLKDNGTFQKQALLSQIEEIVATLYFVTRFRPLLFIPTAVGL